MNDNHLTPKWLIQSLEKEFGKFDLDPCSNLESTYTAIHHFYENQDGLAKKWYGKVFCNPPYSQGNIPKWISKAILEITRKGHCKLIIMLLPSDTSTKWFHQTFCIRYKFGDKNYYVIDTDHEIRLLDRINFSNSKNNAKFPSMLVIMR